VPGLGDVLDAVGSVAVNRYSFELFRETITRLSREITASRLRAGLGPPDELTAYIVELHFNQLADESDRGFFNSVPTRLQLPVSTVDRLKHLAAVELKRNPEFQRLVQDLGPIDRSLALNGATAIVPFATFRSISQNFSPAGVTSPCFARAMPTERTSFVPVNGR